MALVVLGDGEHHNATLDFLGNRGRIRGLRLPPHAERTSQQVGSGAKIGRDAPLSLDVCLYARGVTFDRRVAGLPFLHEPPHLFNGPVLYRLSTDQTSRTLYKFL
jgi:hypothetical protein